LDVRHTILGVVQTTKAHKSTSPKIDRDYLTQRLVETACTGRNFRFPGFKIGQF